MQNISIFKMSRERLLIEYIDLRNKTDLIIDKLKAENDRFREKNSKMSSAMGILNGNNETYRKAAIAYREDNKRLKTPTETGHCPICGGYIGELIDIKKEGE